MTKPSRYSRPPKFDRFTSPDASHGDTAKHYALAPFDEAVRAADLKWGVDRLPGLVSPDLAARWGTAMAQLHAAIEGDDVAILTARVGACLRGIIAMDQEATTAGHALADPQIWQMEVDGFKFAIIRDARMWPALKKAQPDLVIFTDREIANAVKAYALDSIKDAFPQAEITKITPRDRTPMEELVDDEIPY